MESVVQVRRFFEPEKRKQDEAARAERRAARKEKREVAAAAEKKIADVRRAAVIKVSDLRKLYEKMSEDEGDDEVKRGAEVEQMRSKTRLAWDLFERLGGKARVEESGGEEGEGSGGAKRTGAMRSLVEKFENNSRASEYSVPTRFIHPSR